MSRLRFLIAEGWRGIVRHRSLTAASVIASIASYGILAAFLVLAVNLRAASSDVASRKEVVLFVRDSLSADSVQTLLAQTQHLPGVQRARLVSRDQALEELSKDLGDARELVDAIGANPLPQSIRLTLRPDARDAVRIAALADTLTGMDGVEDVRYGEEWVERFDFIARRMKIGTLAVGALVALGALLVLWSTIRLAVVARQDLVDVLQLVGASRRFTAGPFIAEALMISLAGMSVALLVTWGLTAAVQSWIPGFIFLTWRGILAALGFALAIGLLGSLVALAGVLRGPRPTK